MILTDTGPLVALINRNDPNHSICVAAAKKLPSSPLVTTWPCFTEAMYLSYRVGSYFTQIALWQLWATGRLILHDLTRDEMNRMASLMDKYQDTPMDLADASIVVVAEFQRMRQVFTLDSDFHIYRLSDGSALELIPFIHLNR